MTLMEVMCALGILVVLSAGIMVFFVQMSARRDRLVELAARERDASLVFDRLESALMHAVAVGPDGGAGVEGDEASVTVVSRTVAPALSGEAALDDAVTLTLEFDESRGACVLGLAPAGGSGPAQPVLAGLERMRIRYSDGRRWSDSYDSLTAGGLPVAVEVSLWFGSGAGDEEDDGAMAGGFGPGPVRGVEGAATELVPDLPPGEEEEVWTPREPDHVRVIGVPDAPDWKERGA